MTPRHQISRAAIELIKRFEGYRRTAAVLPDGRWTIGYGHTLTARRGAQVSEADAEALLIYDLIAVAHAINEAVFAPLSQNEFDALCSFVFNIGTQDFSRSAVLRRLNEGAHLNAACAMEMWRKADIAGERILIDALIRRRAAEKALFLTPQEGWLPAPTPMLQPILDLEVAGSVLRGTPAVVRTSLDGDVAAAELVVAGDRSPDAVGLQSAFPESAAPPEEAHFALTPPDEAPPEGQGRIFGRRDMTAGEPSADLFNGERTPANDTPGASDWPAESPPQDAGAAAKVAGRTPRVGPNHRKPDLSALWGLGAAGLGLFLLGLIGTLHKPVAPGAPGLTVLGWFVGLVGVVLFSMAAYRLLRRLGEAARDQR